MAEEVCPRGGLPSQAGQCGFRVDGAREHAWELAQGGKVVFGQLLNGGVWWGRGRGHLGQGGFVVVVVALDEGDGLVVA